MGHFKGVRVKKGVAHFPHTGAEIPLNATFFKSAIPIVLFNSYLLLKKYARTYTGQPVIATLAFHPQPSGPWYNAWLAARMAGIDIIKDPYSADIVFVFDDKTESNMGEVLDSSLKAKAINLHIEDISKTHVAKTFAQVFGYDIEIDPLTYKGKAVQKSDINGTHDGIVIDCPLSPDAVKPGCAYQRLVDSTFSDRGSEDLRMAYIGGEIPVVFHKYKALDKRFGTDYAHVDIWNADQAFSEDEQRKLIEFCEAMGLDFGAVDVMRDKHDGRIYVVDVNKTCMPVLSLSQKEQRRAFRLIADALTNLIERVKA
ncbi:ATP-grasp domain-containing protein [Hellea balneolensis]|uniref:hypothetical protein n=1 Tax=Hellea balneolensis TaxID=287478 RepID=UPI00138AD309|nr:hypothetical protein [Hellea balneolensis]